MTVGTGARGGKYPPSEERRRAFAKDVKYEFDMVMNTTMFMHRNSAYSIALNERDTRGEPITKEERWRISTYNSILESWTIHNRALLEFFTPLTESKKGARSQSAKRTPVPKGRRGYDDTAAAEDFVIGHEAWAEMMVSYVPDSHKEQTNKRVAHMSYSRLDLKNDWSLRFVEETLKLGLRFLEATDAEVFPPETAQWIRAQTAFFLSGVWIQHPEWIPDLEKQVVERPSPF
jgi:hypothetical protein